MTLDRTSAPNFIGNITGPYTKGIIDERGQQVSTVGEVSTAVQVSDVHLGYQYSNADDFLDFLESELENIDPDLLVLSGDILEFWRSSIQNVFTQYSKHISSIYSLAETDTEVKIIAGNHDYRLIESDSPIEVVDAVRFTSGNTKFKSIHGQRYDPKNANNRTNEALCLTSEDVGELMSDIYGLWSDGLATGVFQNRVEFGLPGVTFPAGQLQHLNNPESLNETESVNRLELIENTIERVNDRHVIYGHTHRPKGLEESTNVGSFTSDTNSYAIVKSGDVSLRTYEA